MQSKTVMVITMMGIQSEWKDPEVNGAEVEALGVVVAVEQVSEMAGDLRVVVVEDLKIGMKAEVMIDLEAVPSEDVGGAVGEVVQALKDVQIIGS